MDNFQLTPSERRNALSSTLLSCSLIKGLILFMGKSGKCRTSKRIQVIILKFHLVYNLNGEAVTHNPNTKSKELH